MKQPVGEVAEDLARQKEVLIARDALRLPLAEGVGRHRMAGWLSFVIRALAIARLTGLAIALPSKRPAQTGNPAELPSR